MRRGRIVCRVVRWGATFAFAFAGMCEARGQGIEPVRIQDPVLAEALYGAFVASAASQGRLEHVGDDGSGADVSRFDLLGVLRCEQDARSDGVTYACDVTGDLEDPETARTLAAAVNPTAARVTRFGAGFDVEGSTDTSHLPFCVFNSLSCMIDLVVGGTPTPDRCVLQNAVRRQCV
jgi:hypothetical protein